MTFQPRPGKQLLDCLLAPARTPRARSLPLRENLCRGSPTSRADAGMAGHRRADKRRRAVMLEVGHTATRLSCFAPVSRCCDGSARAGCQTSRLPGSGVLATRYPDLSKPRVRAQAVPRPLPCSYGARRPWCARLGKASSRSEHVAKIYVLTGSRAGPTPAGMEFNRPRTKSYSVAALSGSTIRGSARCVTWILSGGPDRHRSALLLGPEPATLRRHVSGKWVPAVLRTAAVHIPEPNI